MKTINELPAGWDDQRLREVLDHYENQTDEEAARDHDAALANPALTVMEVPSELVPIVRQLIAEHQRAAQRS